MTLSILQPPKSVRRALIAVQAIPLVSLIILGIVFLFDKPERGPLTWLRETYGIAWYVHPSIAFLLAAIYAYGCWRFYAKQRRDFHVVIAMTSSSVSVIIHALLVGYYQTQIAPGAPLTLTALWILLAMTLYILTWFSVTFQAWLWETRVEYAHRSN